MRRLLSSLAIALTLAACGPNTSDVQSRAVVELTAVNDTFNAAAAAHDAETLVGLYSDNPVWIEPGKPAVISLDKPRQLFEFVTANKGHVTHTIDHLFVSDDATLAVMIGSVVAKVESAGMDATGTYLFVLKPEDEGWDVVVDMWQQHSE